MTSIKEGIGELIASLAPNQRLMGLDVGEKTIGMAVGDALHGIASPVSTIRRTKFSTDMVEMKKIIAERKVGGFVIGYPINMNGTEGPKCQSIRQFSRNIMQATGLPVLLWDERMSTMAVTRTLLDADVSRQRRAELVDKLAASYILQGAFDQYAIWKKNNAS